VWPRVSGESTRAPAACCACVHHVHQPPLCRVTRLPPVLHAYITCISLPCAESLVFLLYCMRTSRAETHTHSTESGMGLWVWDRASASRLVAVGTLPLTPTREAPTTVALRAYISGCDGKRYFAGAGVVRIIFSEVDPVVNLVKRWWSFPTTPSARSVPHIPQYPRLLHVYPRSLYLFPGCCAAQKQADRARCSHAPLPCPRPPQTADLARWRRVGGSWWSSTSTLRTSSSAPNTAFHSWCSPACSRVHTLHTHTTDCGGCIMIAVGDGASVCGVVSGRRGRGCPGSSTSEGGSPGGTVATSTAGERHHPSLVSCVEVTGSSTSEGGSPGGTVATSTAGERHHPSLVSCVEVTGSSTSEGGSPGGTVATSTAGERHHPSLVSCVEVTGSSSFGSS
jgi:hypothetical protein